jgi:hypothetical protein
MDSSPDKPRDPRYRDTHPERIKIGDKTLERQDLTAKRYGESERSMNRRDRQGAPFIFIKYRPLPDYDTFMLGCIKRTAPKSESAPKRRGRR